MKIKLLVDLPIDKKHGCFKGEVFDNAEHRGEGRGNRLFYFIAKDGSEAAAYPRECEVIHD